MDGHSLELDLWDFYQARAIEIQSAAGVRYAGVAGVTPPAFASAMQLLMSWRTAVFLVTSTSDADGEDGARALFTAAFPQRKGVPDIDIDWLSLAARRCPGGDVLIRVTGQDCEGGASADLVMTDATLAVYRTLLDV